MELGAAILLACCAIWYFVAHRLTRRTDRIIRELNRASEARCKIQVMTKTMGQIQSAGADVVKTNKIIDEIAFQTKILVAERRGGSSSRRRSRSRIRRGGG
jgi:hypothetical protein